MTDNSSSFSNSSFENEFYYCSSFKVTITICAFIITKSILIIPLTGLVLYLGHQRWSQQRSFENMSNSDIFTYHLTVMELIGTFGGPVYLCGFAIPNMFTVGICLIPPFICGETMFHLLTCVERYLAVVHPFTYLELKNAGWVRMRNICIVCVWLSSFGWVGVMILYVPDIPTIPFFCLLVFSLIIVSFCSITVLYVLIRPQPGKVGIEREKVDRLKQRAFYTIMAITGVLWLMVVGDLICVTLNTLALWGAHNPCFLFASGLWLSLPSSLVLQLLFLHRAGKLTF